MDITNVKRETLVKQYEEAKAKFEAANEGLKKDFEQVFLLWFAENGISSFCTFKAYDDGFGELFVTGEKLGISVRYSKRWKDNGSARYELTMNFSCFCSFSDTEGAKVKHAQVIGYLATDLSDLQNRLSRLNWVHTHELKKIFCRAECALEGYDSEVEAAEHDRKVAEILPLIKVGMRVYTGRKSYDDKEIIATIIEMKRKYIDFDRVSKRMTREEIAEKIISGKWEIRA